VLRGTRGAMIKTNISKLTFASIACLMLMTGVVSADTKVKSRQTSGGQTMENTSYIKGKRQRTEMNNGQMITIQQCDLRRNIQIMPQAQAYVIQPYDDATTATTNAQGTASQPNPTTKGGVVTSTVTSRDTGERKQMFGYTARHIITTMITESSPDACSQTKSKMEIDGWYIDAAFALDCGSPNYSSSGSKTSGGGCRDRYVTKQLGTAKRGYPVWEKTTMFDGNGNPSYSSINEVIEFSQATLEPSLFEVPAGYREVPDFASAFSTAAMGSTTQTDNAPNTSANQPTNTPAAIAAKKAGVTRFGLAKVRTSAVGEGLNASELAAAVQNSLTASLQGAKLEVVLLEGQYDREVTAEATKKECDYIIYANVSHKKGGGGGFGGMLKGVSVAGIGVGSTEPTTSSSGSSANIKAKDEVTLDVRLELPGSTIPKLSKQFKAKAASAGQDIITSVSQQAAQAISEVTAK
jgi:hypothetical protein